ncbi:phage antirepressor N-terminal domain-containing protein [Halomonas colorata]|uniref:phage antirepressor N-terminal domain-containing protein n=1 Tax=Halomonas colorata TaxID=2742615 RepID=UPI001868D185|nr:phage antirepressor N-terminal domain-containing protein [Halomonas colorata]
MTTITASPVSIDFHGAAIPTFNLLGIVRVAMRPICDAIGIEWHGQRQRINRNPVLKTCAVIITSQLPGDTQRRQFLTIPLSKLNGWLFGVDASRVKPAIREKLIEYQEECFEVLSDYWQKGEATNARQETLSGTTIGTDGFRCLAAVVDGKLNRLPAAIRRSAKSHLWQQVHKAFSVVSAEDIPVEQMDSARNFVAAYAIEGDYISRQEQPAPVPVTAQPAIHYPMEYWPHINARMRNDWASELPTLEKDRRWVRAEHLYGESAPSPTLHLLAQLKLAGFDVSCCRAEVQAMRHHIEVAASTRREIERMLSYAPSLRISVAR